MLELLGTMLQQNQEQGKSFMTAVQAMAVEQERQALGLREAVSNMSSKHASSPQLSKLLQRPDVFRPKDREEELTMWYEWAWTFKQWMLAVDASVHDHMEEVERDLAVSIDEDTMTDDAISMGKQLYAILTTMLKERPLHILNSIPNNNGFEACTQLWHLPVRQGHWRCLEQYPNTRT